MDVPVPRVVGRVLVCIGVVSDAGDEVIGPAVSVRIDDEADGFPGIDGCRVRVPVQTSPHAVAGVAVGISLGIRVVLEGVVDVAEPTPAVVITARTETCLHVVGEGVVRMSPAGLGLVRQESGAGRVDRLGVVRVVLSTGHHVIDCGGLSCRAAADEVVVALAVPVAEDHSGSRRPAAAVPDVRRDAADEHAPRACGRVAWGALSFARQRRVDGEGAGARLARVDSDQIGLERSGAGVEVCIREQHSGFESLEARGGSAGHLLGSAGAIRRARAAPGGVVSHVAISLLK